MELVKSVRPHQVTLVPDPPDAITSNSGWDTITNLSFLQDIIGELKECGIRTSIFIDANPDFVVNAVKTNTDRVELYTEPYATQFPKDPEKAIAPFVEAANIANKAGLRINAGHDLNLQNLKFFNERIPFIKEVSIGHALISDALYYGLELTIKKYKELLIKET
jgi:pyridoxine 5-phosphate synthase